MKREWLLAAGTVLVTTVLTVALIRWLAPQLPGLPVDMQMVQVSKRVPPFYSNIFREKDIISDQFVIKDPLVNVRFKPLLTFVAPSPLPSRIHPALTDR
jgi:hypothetical protein